MKNGGTVIWEKILYGSFFCVVRKKKERKRKAGRQANASESNMLLPGLIIGKSHKIYIPRVGLLEGCEFVIILSNESESREEYKLKINYQRLRVTGRPVRKGIQR